MINLANTLQRLNLINLQAKFLMIQIKKKLPQDLLNQWQKILTKTQNKHKPLQEIKIVFSLLP